MKTQNTPSHSSGLLNLVLTAVPSSLLLFACNNVGFNHIDDGSFTKAGDKVYAVDQQVEAQGDNDVDILFVVDNSASMKDEQVGFGAKINGFMSSIQNLNWRIALTTTDPRTTTKDASGVNQQWGDGQFRQFGSSSTAPYVLKAGEVSLSNAQIALNDAIQVGLLGSGNESGVAVSYRAIQRSLVASPNKDFFRPNARLAIVLISDEDECSDGQCWLSTNTAPVLASNPANLILLTQSTFGMNKVMSFNSIVHLANDPICKAGKVGSTYEGLSKQTGGVTGSVCATDYTATLSKLSSKVIELTKSVQLNCFPADMDSDGKPDLSIVLANGTRVTSGYKLSGTLLTFDSPLPLGRHTFSYHCAM